VIYIVEHTFSRPDLEADWNAWYAGNLKVLLGVPGIESAQRFRVNGVTPPRFMAMYTLTSPDVFESEAYRNAGGGGSNSLRFRPAYQVWIRNVFDGLDEAPAVETGSCLIVCDAPEPNVELPGVTLAWMRSVGLHRTTPCRGLGVADRTRASGLAGRPDVVVYEPSTPRYAAQR